MKKLKFTCVFLALLMFSGILFNGCAQKPEQNAIEPIQEEERAREFTREEIKVLVLKSPTCCNITEGTYMGIKTGMLFFGLTPNGGVTFGFRKSR